MTTLLLPFPSGTRRASPVDSASLHPCRRCYPATALLLSQPVSARKSCLRPQGRVSASEICLLRGYLYVHVSYNPDRCSSRPAGLCRWASEGNVSISPCHPSYVALAFTTTGLPPVRMRYPSLGTLPCQRPTPGSPGHPEALEKTGLRLSPE